jgi:TolB-like protein
MPATSQRRLAAIVVADVVGYSRLMAADEAGTLAALKERRQAILAPTVRAHGGRVVKLMGDGVLIEFASAVNAVEAALALQQKFAEANATRPEDRRIVLRIGINLGDVIVEGSDLYGDGVNLAERLQAVAEPGGIVLSGSAFDQVRNKTDAVFEDLGNRDLKNIAEPVRLYRVAGMPLVPVAAPKAAADRPSIAVLPFANLGGDAAQSYFSDGITEDIITELSRWRQLAVRSRSASFRHGSGLLPAALKVAVQSRSPAFAAAGVPADIKQVARELNVRYLVEGSVRRMGERVRITAQLIDTETDSHVWAERFDRELAEIFAVQDQVVRTIVGTVVGRVHAADAERARRKPPSALAAYEYVLKGNAMPWSDPNAVAEATRLFAKAIEIDAGYGFAHAMLAEMRCLKWLDDTSSSDAALQEAYGLAKRAVELDAGESASVATLGRVYLLRRSYDLALQYVQRAFEINPNNQWNTADMGNVLTYLGRAEAALDWFKRAREIDPYFEPAWYWYRFGMAYVVLRRYEEALSTFEHLTSRRYWDAALMACCHAELADKERAQVLAAECLAKKPDFSIGHFMAKEPFRNPADAAHLGECLRRAGLPECPAASPPS